MKRRRRNRPDCRANWEALAPVLRGYGFTEDHIKRMARTRGNYAVTSPTMAVKLLEKLQELGFTKLQTISMAFRSPGILALRVETLEKKLQTLRALLMTQDSFVFVLSRCPRILEMKESGYLEQFAIVDDLGWEVLEKPDIFHFSSETLLWRIEQLKLHHMYDERQKYMACRGRVFSEEVLGVPWVTGGPHDEVSQDAAQD